MTHTLRTLLQRLVQHGPDLEQLQAHNAHRAPDPFSVPVHWSGPDGKVHLRGRSAVIVTPSAEELAQHGHAQPRSTCGHCRYFDLHTGRREMARQRIAERLVHEHAWKLHHLGAPPEQLALCGASGGETIVAAVSQACAQFRPRRR